METVEEKRSRFYQKTLSRSEILARPFKGQSLTDPKESADAYVLAPLLNLFVIWMLKNALKDQIRVLFFLARDGYLMYQTAARICEKFHLDIDCRYVYCSRYSLRVPMYSEDLKEAVGHITRGGIDVSLEKVLIRAGFEEKEIPGIYAGLHLPWKLKEILAYPELTVLKEKLSDDSKFLEKLRERSKKRWPMLHEYFLQNGLLEEAGIGIADSGWTGTTQKSICDIRRRSGVFTPVKGYYFGLYEVPDRCDPKDYRSFYFSPQSDLKNKVFFGNCFFETVFRSPEGTTIGYRQESGRIVPLLAETGEEEPAVSRLEKICRFYTERLLTRCSKEELFQMNIKKQRAILEASVRNLMWNPTSFEAEYYGRTGFSDDLLDDHAQELAPLMTMEEIKQNHFFNKLLTAFGIRRRRIRESAWFEASVKRSTGNTWHHRVSFSAYRMFSFLRKGIKTKRK